MHRLKQRYLMVFIALLTLSSVMFSGCSLLEDKHVTLVKEGTMEIVPNVKIGKAFDQFFSDGKWEYFVATDNSKVVEFTGTSRWQDKPAKAKVQFVILNDTRFQLWTIEINGDNMRDSDAIAVMKKILTQYHAK